MIIKKNIWKRYRLCDVEGLSQIIDWVIKSRRCGKWKGYSFDFGLYKFIKFNNNRMIIEWKGHRYFIVVVLGEIRIRVDEINKKDS